MALCLPMCAYTSRLVQVDLPQPQKDTLTRTATGIYIYVFIQHQSDKTLKDASGINPGGGVKARDPERPQISP